jgi:hypothetical protein
MAPGAGARTRAGLCEETNPIRRPWEPPVRAGLFQAQAAEARWSRMVAGIHYQSHIDAGATLGHNVARLAISWAKNDGSGN